MDIFFTSDTHFGHKNIIEYCNRPFKSVEEMDEKLIENWNKVVKYDDLVYHLGDFCLGVGDKTKYAKQIKSRLNGSIHLFLGNHDPDQWLHAGEDNLFHCVEHYRETHIGKQKLVMFHYPMRTWNGATKGSYHLFGHVHGTMKGVGRSLDVGVDSNNFTPINLEEITQKLKNIQVVQTI